MQCSKTLNKVIFFGKLSLTNFYFFSTTSIFFPPSPPTFPMFRKQLENGAGENCSSMGFIYMKIFSSEAKKSIYVLAFSGVGGGNKKMYKSSLLNVETHKIKYRRELFFPRVTPIFLYISISLQRMISFKNKYFHVKWKYLVYIYIFLCGRVYFLGRKMLLANFFLPKYFRKIASIF